MKSSDIPLVEDRIREVEDAARRVSAEVRHLGESLERLVAACSDEPELLSVISKERRYLQALQSMVKDFPVVRQLKRRLPIVESRLRREEQGGQKENSQVARRAEEVRSSLEDLLRRFLN